MNKILLLAGVILIILQGLSLATITVNFNNNLQPGQISFYWGADSSSPNLGGRTISSNNETVLNLSDGSQAKTTKSPLPSNQFAFYSDSSSVPSQTTKLRVWDSTSHDRGKHYTALESYANPWGSPATYAFNRPYEFIRDIPQNAVITKYDETSTTIINPASIDKQLVISSSQPPRGDGYSVEIVSAQWEIIRNNGEPYVADGSGSALTLSSRTGTVFNPGDVFTLRVRHKNYWNDWGGWSSPVSYTVGAGGGGRTTALAYTLQPGVNGIGIPFGTPFNLVSGNSTIPVSSLGDLINAIKQIGGKDSISAVAYWDAGLQGATYNTKGEISYNSDGYRLTYQPGSGSVLQITVLRGVNFSLQKQ